MSKTECPYSYQEPNKRQSLSCKFVLAAQSIICVRGVVVHEYGVLVERWFKAENWSRVTWKKNVTWYSFNHQKSDKLTLGLNLGPTCSSQYLIT